MIRDHLDIGRPSSVAAVESALVGEDKTFLAQLATDPLIFPSQADFSRLHRYRVLSTAEEKTWNSMFEPIFQS